MLRAEHCRRRAERRRNILLCTKDAAASARLREIIEKYPECIPDDLRIEPRPLR